jgi:hypothetical protein
MLDMIQAVNFGGAFIVTILACTEGSLLDEKGKNRQKLKLNEYMKLFNVQDLSNDLSLLIKNSREPNFLPDIVELAQSFKNRMIILDPSEGLGKYFYLSFIVNFIDLSLESVKIGGGKFMLEVCYLLYRKAEEISKNLRIKTPEVSDESIEYNLELTHTLIKDWLININKSTEGSRFKNAFRALLREYKFGKALNILLYGKE